MKGPLFACGIGLPVCARAQLAPLARGQARRPIPLKPNIAQLLIDSVLQPELRRRLAETPSQVFGEYDLSDEERECLLNPDHRLLPLLGAALSAAHADRLQPEADAP